jgi:hypothetical protein
MKVRVNQYFAKKLLDGKTWGSIDWAVGDIGTNLGADFSVSGWVITGGKGDGKITFDLKYLSDPEESVFVDLPRYSN